MANVAEMQRKWEIERLHQEALDARGVPANGAERFADNVCSSCGGNVVERFVRDHSKEGGKWQSKHGDKTCIAVLGASIAALSAKLKEIEKRLA